MTLARPVAINPGELSAYLRLRFVESSNATPCRNQIIATSDSLTVSQTTSRAEKCQSNGLRSVPRCMPARRAGAQESSVRNGGKSRRRGHRSHVDQCVTDVHLQHLTLHLNCAN